MGGVVIPANDEWLAFFVEFFEVVEGGVVKIEFEFEPIFGGFAVGEIDIEENEVFKFGGLDAAFVVEVVVVEAGGEAYGFSFGVDRGSAVAFFGGGMKVGEVSFGVFELFAELAFVGFDFLECEDVWTFVLEPCEEAFFFDGAEAVYVPGDDFHLRFLMASAKWAFSSCPRGLSFW